MESHASAAMIEQQLFNLVKEWGSCDLLLDRELADPLASGPFAAAAVQVNEPAIPINPLRAALPPEQCLMLMRLRLAPLAVLDLSAQLTLRQNTNPAQPIRSYGGWLFSRDVPAPQLARHLERAQIVRIENSPNAVLRLWDPRVLAHLPRILTAPQLAAIMGPIERWAWVDRSGILQTLDKPGVQPAPWLMLSAEQDAAIDRVAHINAVLKALAFQGQVVPPDRDAELDELVLTAQRKGHVQEPDVLAYVLHALLVCKTFDSTPEVRHAIEAAQAQGNGLCAALEPFDDAYWAGARSGAQREHQPTATLVKTSNSKTAA